RADRRPGELRAPPRSVDGRARVRRRRRGAGPWDRHPAARAARGPGGRGRRRALRRRRHGREPAGARRVRRRGLRARPRTRRGRGRAALPDRGDGALPDARRGARPRRGRRVAAAVLRPRGRRGGGCVPSSLPRLNATFAPRALPPGRIGFSSQSGALGLALLEKAAERRLGFSAFVSIGNKADVSSNDLLEWWEDDAETDVVLLYLESF